MRKQKRGILIIKTLRSKHRSELQLWENEAGYLQKIFLVFIFSLFPGSIMLPVANVSRVARCGKKLRSGQSRKRAEV